MRNGKHYVPVRMTKSEKRQIFKAQYAVLGTRENRFVLACKRYDC